MMYIVLSIFILVAGYGCIKLVSYYVHLTRIDLRRLKYKKRMSEALLAMCDSKLRSTCSFEQKFSKFLSNSAADINRLIEEMESGKYSHEDVNRLIQQTDILIMSLFENVAYNSNVIAQLKTRWISIKNKYDTYYRHAVQYHSLLYKTMVI